MYKIERFLIVYLFLYSIDAIKKINIKKYFLLQ